MKKTRVRLFVVMCGMLLGAVGALRADIGTPIGGTPITDTYKCTGSSPDTDCCSKKFSEDRYDCLICCSHTFDSGSQSNQNTDCNNACPKH